MKELSQRISQWFAAIISMLLIASLAIVIWFFIADESPFRFPLIIYLIWTLMVSLVCAVMYFLDKRRAIKQTMRIPEKRLHLVEILGGWPGAVIARRAFRHKTKKTSYRIRFWLIVLLHGGIIAWVLFGDSSA